MVALTYGQTILAMFLLALLVALWGIYREVRQIAQKMREKS